MNIRKKNITNEDQRYKTLYDRKSSRLFRPKQ